jgi:hypothetical protein
MLVIEFSQGICNDYKRIDFVLILETVQAEHSKHKAFIYLNY